MVVVLEQEQEQQECQICYTTSVVRSSGTIVSKPKQRRNPSSVSSAMMLCSQSRKVFLYSSIMIMEKVFVCSLLLVYTTILYLDCGWRNRTNYPEKKKYRKRFTWCSWKRQSLLFCSCCKKNCKYGSSDEFGFLFLFLLVYSLWSLTKAMYLARSFTCFLSNSYRLVSLRRWRFFQAFSCRSL